MSKKKKFHKLNTQLIFAIILSFVLAISLFWGCSFAADQGLKCYYKTTGKRIFQTQLQELKDFVAENNYNFKENKKEILDHFTTGTAVYDGIYFAIYSDETGKYMYGTSDVLKESEIRKTLSVFFEDIPFFRNRYMDALYRYQGCTVIFYYYFPLELFLISLVGAVLLSVIVFFACFSYLIRKKIKYILKLGTEISAMESGDLAHSVTVAGNDELSLLAQNIDHLRCSLEEQSVVEAEAQKANSELITAMSHDLRTPLTALMGYLEIIGRKKYKDEKQFERYLVSSMKKAEQIKELSDRLFEYFLVFGSDEPLRLEPFSGRELLDRLARDYSLTLQNTGFSLVYALPTADFLLHANLPALCRTFDNLFSNVQKYGDPSVTVKLSAKLSGNRLLIHLTNKILPDHSVTESNGIGLKSCDRLIKKHGGTLQFQTISGSFAVEIRLPAVLP